MALELVKTLFALVAVLGLMFVVVWDLNKICILRERSKSAPVDIEVGGQNTVQPKM